MEAIERTLMGIIGKKSVECYFHFTHIFFSRHIKLWESFQKTKWKMQMLVISSKPETVVIKFLEN